jgi:hypothetical protein
MIENEKTENNKNIVCDTLNPINIIEDV